MDWLKRFMMGRYGGDQLSVVLLVLSIFLTILVRLINLPLLAVIAYIPLVICIYRMFSRDISKRSMENYKFAMLVSPLYTWFRKTRQRVKDTKTHKYFKCQNCKTTLRVPKGKGKIIITCPKCKIQFTKKT